MSSETVRLTDSLLVAQAREARHRSRRERIATRICAAYTAQGITGTHEEVADWSIIRADALIEALDRKSVG
jgi:hypothetical protein